MEFEILGPLRVRAEGQPVPITATMLRTLLGILIARANTPVGVDTLVDALWGGKQVEAAHKKVQLHVHRLRRRLGDPGRIRFEHSGYTLAVRPDEVDANRFEQLLADGAAASADPAHAITLLRDALTLWRGDPFSDVGDVLLLRSAADRLAERRLVGLQDLYAAELAAGQAAAIVPDLAELAARHPLRERLQALLMTALYRAGRQPEALAVYRRTRSTLVDELGIEPGAELQRIEQAILVADPDLDGTAPAAVAAPAQLPADITDFVGRDTQIREVYRHLTSGGPTARTASNGPPTGVVPASLPTRVSLVSTATRPLAVTPAGVVAVAAISGKPGVGKTTLAVHLGHRLRDHFPDGQLYVNLRGAGTQALDAAEVLARFLRALGMAGSAVPEDPEERAALYRSRLAGRRMLVLLDNASGEHQVRPLLPGTPGCAVLVTSRARLAGLTSARSVDLDVLDPDQAVALLGSLLGPARIAAEPGVARQIAARCGYLPLAVRIAGARLAARPHRRLARLAADLDDEHRRLDELSVGDLEVRASLALSYESLDEPARCAFRRLGMLDSADFPAWTAAALMDIEQPRAEDLVDALVDAQLVDVVGRDPVGQLRYRFHDLLRAYARELAAQEPLEARTAALSRVFGGWLSLAQEAGQRITTSNFGFTPRPMPCWRPDETVVNEVLGDPAGWFGAEWSALLGAVEQAAELTLHELSGALGMRLAPVFVVRGHYDDWRRICERTLSGALHSRNRWWEGSALRGLGELAAMQFRLDSAVRCFTGARAAFEAIDDEFGQALADAGLGAALAELGRFGEAQAHLDSARTTMGMLGELRSRVWVLRRLGRLHQLQQRYDDAAAYFQQALAGLDESEGVAKAGLLERLGEIRTLQGRGVEAHTVIERALRLHRQHGDLFGEARALGSLGELHRREDRPEQALDCLADALRRWRQLGLPREQAQTLEVLGTLHEHRGASTAAAIARREAQLLLDELKKSELDQPTAGPAG